MSTPFRNVLCLPSYMCGGSLKAILMFYKYYWVTPDTKQSFFLFTVFVNWPFPAALLQHNHNINLYLKKTLNSTFTSLLTIQWWPANLNFHEIEEKASCTNFKCQTNSSSFLSQNIDNSASLNASFLSVHGNCSRVEVRVKTWWLRVVAWNTL